jgi:hypothetical protein|tara:strand:- start:1731 stop:1982 length:252 start_codon:yes stop_codon:yes gene_type:complete
MDGLIKLVEEFGFPIVMTFGMGYFIWFVWRFVTTELKPKLGEASGVLIALIDRIRMLDNDLIRLQQKVNVVLEYNEKEEDKKE